MNHEFKNNAAKSWEHVLSQKDDFVKLFDNLQLENYKDIQIVSRTFSNDDRLIVAVDMMDMQGITSRVIIDATAGIPTWRQFINVTYESGKFTDTKIVLYEQDYKDYPNHLAGGKRQLSYLTRYNNKCGVKTYLVKGIALDHKDQKILTTCDIVSEPNNVELVEGLKHPSKADAQKAEFWLGYYCEHCDDGEINVGMDDDIFGDWNPGRSTGRADVEAYVVWDDDGLFLKLVGGLGSEAIKWIWDNRKFAFEVVYLNCPVAYETHHNYCAISVKIEDFPLHEIFAMDPDKKWEYGGLVHDEQWKFLSVARKIAEDYDDNYLPTRQLLEQDMNLRLAQYDKENNSITIENSTDKEK